MAGAKKPDNRLVRRFVSRLVRELVEDSDTGFSLAANAQVLKEALRNSVNSLPSGALRSSLEAILEQERHQESIILALQIELRVFSVQLELHSDILLTSSVSEHLFQTLLDWIDKKTEYSFTEASGKHWMTHDEVRLLLARDPAIYILWVLAAMELGCVDRDNGELASALFHCLKPWLVDRNMSVAIAAIAPLVPFILKSLQTNSNQVGTLKTIRKLVKEVLSFTVALKYKERFIKKFQKIQVKETLSFQSLLDGFCTLLKAFDMQGTLTLTETLSTEEKLNNMFPFASGVTESILKPPYVRIGLLADIVKAEFLLLYMIVEVLHRRENSKGGDKMVKGDTEVLKELLGRIGVYDLTAGQTDIILDILLSNLSSLSTLLVDEEKSFVCISIFKALLLYKHKNREKDNIEKLSKSRKSLEGFVKRIAVARKFSAQERAEYDILEALACHITVPLNVVSYLRSSRKQVTSQIKEFTNDRVFIDWLIQSSDTKFQSFVEEIMNPDLQGAESVRRRKVKVGSTKDSALKQNGHNQAEMEDLFFMDTAGEEDAQDTSTAFRQGKKAKKRKTKQVIFCKQKHTAKVAGNLSLSESSSISSDCEDSQNDVREKNVNESVLSVKTE